MALGASSSSVAARVVRQGVAAVAYGLLGGLPFAVLAARIAGSMLWGVSASDPAVYVACAALLSLVALASAYVPARRAAAVQPLETLRHS
jgi:putative ABC transport system permease protein